MASWNTVEGLLQIKEGHMQWFLFLAVFFDQQACRMDRIRRSAVDYETTLIRRNSDDVADSAVGNAFEYRHAVRQQTYRPIVCTIRGVAFPLPDRDCGAPLPIHGSPFLFDDLVE
ncbi:hypothetical protein Y032_0279g1181 [Ancylostoma ceylanicum]|uniref:Uncharacterized protein n=1 Tax=Ancylostoma ceylanicum TaxID=53326 RepID=A0A016S7R7_9BILA|nr:hypothetical protein Y032_0279g1181 [Ancylostoma ceylanicum]